MDAAIAENVYAGNAMSRRTQWQYAVLLQRNPYGHVDQAIGKNAANGSIGLIAPNRLVAKDFEDITLDGVHMVFQNTPDTEAPVEMNTWFPQWKAFWAAENVTGTIHNIYTLRGAAVRNPLNWSKEINAALYKFGQEAEVMFASHSWPRWGNARIQEVLRAQRDTYANLNNQVLHYAEAGGTINEIQNVYQVPRSLQDQWAARSYHGDVQNNARAVINRYLGHYDGNPANLIPLSPKDSAPLYVQMMGGSAKMIAKGRQLHARGDDLLASEILDKLVFAEPRNQPARRLLADVYERLGYTAGSTSVRNSFLQGAFELRNGLPAAWHRAPTVRTWSARFDRAVAGLPRHRHGSEEGRVAAFHPEPGHPGQQRALCGRTQRRHPDQRPRLPARQAGPDRDHRPCRTQPRDDRRDLARGAGANRQGQAGRRCRRAATAGRDMVAFTPDFEVSPGTAPAIPLRPRTLPSPSNCPSWSTRWMATDPRADAHRRFAAEKLARY